jgi:HSP20 family protein
MPSEEKGPGHKNGLSGFFEGLNTLLDIVSDLQDEDGGQISRSGEFKSKSGRFSGLYGIRIKSGVDGSRDFERFGDIRSQEGRATVSDEREPMIDVFDETDSLTVVAEIPGVTGDSIELDVGDRTLKLKAASGERRYRKEVALPEDVDATPLSRSYMNGILSVSLAKKQSTVHAASDH